MITLKTYNPAKERPPVHKLTCKKNIGTFNVGETTECQIIPMSGVRYKPGKDTGGKWLDKIGEKENRLMLFNHKQYACETKEELDLCFDEVEP